MPSDFGSELYSDTASLGRSYATIQLIIAVIIFIILIISGIYNQFVPITTNNIMATIINVIKCTAAVQSEQNYSCNLIVNYTVNGTSYTNPITLTNNKKYAIGDQVFISYNIQNPNIISVAQLDSHFLGSISILVGSALLLSCGINFYLSSSNNAYAAGTGISTTFGLLKGSFK